jgi:hypothetical protein
MQYALARGDSTAVRGRFTEILQARRSDLPGDLAPQFAFLEASAVLAAGDTASAVRHLDAMLASLPALRTTILFEPSQAGGLVRAMVLRADLAAVQRDRESIARWVRAVTALWDRSEPELQVIVRRMRSLAQD